MTLLTVTRTSKFKRDVKKVLSRGKDPEKLKRIIVKLMSGEPLPARNHDHRLIGNFKGTRECHIDPDWLLIYTVSKTDLRLERTGTHSELFE